MKTTLKLAAAKDQFAKGDYRAALATATEVGTKAKDLAAAAAAKKDELTKAWAGVSGSLPKAVEAIRAKVEELGKLKKLPKEIDAAKLASAKEGLAKVEGAWKEATDAMGAGNIQDALAKAKPVQEKVNEIAAMLGIQAAPAAAPASPAPAPAK